MGQSVAIQPKDEKNDTIKELTCNYIDLDTYNTKFTNAQILMNLNDNYFGKKIPIPNLIFKSGRGLNLI